MSLAIKSGENKSGRGRGGVSELTFWLNLCFFACPRVLDHFSSLFVIISHEQVKSHMNWQNIASLSSRLLLGLSEVWASNWFDAWSQSFTSLRVRKLWTLHNCQTGHSGILWEKRSGTMIVAFWCLCHVEFFMLFWPWLF